MKGNPSNQGTQDRQGSCKMTLGTVLVSENLHEYAPPETPQSSTTSNTHCRKPKQGSRGGKGHAPKDPPASKGRRELVQLPSYLIRTQRQRRPHREEELQEQWERPQHWTDERDRQGNLTGPHIQSPIAPLVEGTTKDIRQELLEYLNYDIKM